MAARPRFRTRHLGPEALTEAVRERWQALWRASPQRSPFTSWAFAEASAEAHGLRLDLHIVEDADGAWHAAALLPVRRRGPLRCVVVPAFSLYSPVLLAQPWSAARAARPNALQALLAHVGATYAAVDLHLHPSLDDARVATWLGWEARPLYTQQIDLGRDDVFAGWSTAPRRTLRTQQAAYTVDVDAQGIADVVRWVHASYDRHDRRAGLAAGTLERLAARLQEAGCLRTILARSTARGGAEAGLCLLHDTRTACYWLAGSKPGPAMTVLLGDLLPRLRADGFARFEFVGANTASIAEFKRRLGGELQLFFHLRTTRHPLLRLARGLRGGS